MSTPFMTPSQSRNRRTLAARRRRRRRLALSGAAVLVLLAAALAAITLSGRSSAQRTLARSGQHRAPAPPQLSPAGLPLAKPAFALSGLSDPRADPVRIAFHSPPRAGMLFNLSTGQVLWQRHASARLPVASLTKMMTALVTVLSAPASAPVLVTRQAIATNGSKVGVLPLGRQVPLESMLYGLMLPSGNDAAVALAQHVSGSVSAFVARMNAEAASLGLGCTRYSSPSGYYDEGNFSCATDLAALAHVDLEQPRIARVVRTFAAILPFPIKGGKLYLYNNNPLLFYHYQGLTGLKTGYTVAAGRCLVATAERHGVRLGVVLLNSDAPATQARQLLDRGFREVYHLPPIHEAPLPAGA